MIDSHLHLDDLKFSTDVDRVIQRATAAGVQGMITAGVDLDSSNANIAISEQYSQVFVAVGFHPHEAAKFGAGSCNDLRALAGHEKVVAIGEIGLDYYRDHSPRDVQRRVLCEQLKLAADLVLPVVVHSRDAAQDTHEILLEWALEARAGYEGRPLGMMHCFSGDLADALGYVELGFYVSIAGPVTYPNAHSTQEAAAGIPLDRLLVETDAPYLPPQGLRGQRNEPTHVAAVVAQIASLRGLPPEAVAAATTHNAQRLFRLPVTLAAGVAR